MTRVSVEWPAVSAGPSNQARVFTPRIPLGNPWWAPSGQYPDRIRVTLTIRVNELLQELKARRGQWVYVDTDHGPMLVTSAACGLDCYCDALAIPVDTPPSLRPVLGKHNA